MMHFKYVPAIFNIFFSMLFVQDSGVSWMAKKSVEQDWIHQWTAQNVAPKK